MTRSGQVRRWQVHMRKLFVAKNVTSQIMVMIATGYYAD